MDNSINRADYNPIAVFDSGSGGLTVLKALKAAAPYADFIYCADTAYLPYGDKSVAVIEQRLMQITAELVERDNIAGLVVACNTATALAIDKLRSAFSIPIIGVEPGIKPALAASENNCVGVFATHATINSERFANFVEQYQVDADIYPEVCPSFVPLVERLLESEVRSEDLISEIEQAVACHIEALIQRSGGKVDAIALGCTHYPILIKYIKNYILTKKYNIKIVATATAVASHALSQITQYSSNSSLIFTEATEQKYVDSKILELKYKNIK